jgi:hypothetical protein
MSVKFISILICIYRFIIISPKLVDDYEFLNLLAIFFMNKINDLDLYIYKIFDDS